MNAIHQILEDMGLSAKEIRVYLTLLRTGSAPGSMVAQRSGISRSTVNFIGRELAKRGIVSMTKRNGVFDFSAEPPEKLLYLLEREVKKAQEREHDFRKVMGTLKEMVSPQSLLPKIQYYEGKEGMIALYDRMLNMGLPIDSFEEGTRVFKLLPEYALEFPQKRVQRKIPNRCIAPVGSPLNVSNPAQFLQVRTVNPEAFPFTWQIRLCGNLVAIFSFEEDAEVGISIEHADIAKNFHLLFERVWQSLPDQP